MVFSVWFSNNIDTNISTYISNNISNNISTYIITNISKTISNYISIWFSNVSNLTKLITLISILN